MDIKEISKIITGRKNSVFQNDFDYYKKELKNNIFKKNILVIGGAGSIGSSSIKVL